jgi:anaerobic selenocysteine-containing dehydrogenase
MEQIVPSICRACLAFCPILVTVKDGRAVKVEGDPEAKLYEGYTCPKGRALPEQHYAPERLLHSQKRNADGSWSRIDSAAMVGEIAAKVRALIDEHGPRSVAGYVGTGVVAHPTGAAMAAGFFRSFQPAPMMFSAASIDKPGANTSTAMHGNWIAGTQSFDSSDVWMLVGANPVISKSNGVPYNNPGNRLKEAVKRGMKLIVVDPRRTETAKRAHIHLQARPGEDPTILAAMLNVIIREELYDTAFLARHAEGFEALKQAVAPYTPEYAAARAGLEAGDLVAAARTFAKGKRGSVVCSTGVSFSTRSNLSFYLALCLNTLCGRWAKEGERAAFPNTMLPAFTPKAQAYPPYAPVSETPMRVRGLKLSAAGWPTTALPDEILEEGPGRIRALFCLGGNPMLAFPDQERTRRALEKLDLLVVLDWRHTETTAYADYVVASPLTLEVPAATYFVEWLKYIGISRGFQVPWAQYTPKIVDPPAGADLMDDREFFFRLAAEMKFEIEYVEAYGYGPHVESPARRWKLDMTRLPSVDELIEHTAGAGRVPLSEVKKHPHGRLFDNEVNVPVAPADPDNTARLNVGHPLMVTELAEVRAEDYALRRKGYALSLVARRENNFMNSLGQSLPGLSKGRSANPVWLHPDDLARLGLKAGEAVRVRSAHDSIVARAEADPSMRPGVISMPQGAATGSADGKTPPVATSVTRLISLDECDPMTGIPRMSAIPVNIERVAV